MANEQEAVEAERYLEEKTEGFEGSQRDLKQVPSMFERKPADVQTNIYDLELQGQVINILKSRLGNKYRARNRMTTLKDKVASAKPAFLLISPRPAAFSTLTPSHSSAAGRRNSSPRLLPPVHQKGSPEQNNWP